jgi:hypothetical protein
MPELKNIVKRVKAAAREKRIPFEILEEVFADPSTKFVDVQGKMVLSEILTRTALKLKPNDALLRKAFETCDLDPERPLHWRTLLDALVEICFQDGGAPEKWTWEAFFDLGRDIKSVWNRDGKLNSDAAIARRLKASKLLRSKYEGLGNAALAKLIGKAQDPAFNPAFNQQTDDGLMMSLTKNLVVEGGREWTAETELLVRPFAEKMWEKFYQRELEQQVFSHLVEKHGKGWTEEAMERNRSSVKAAVRAHFMKASSKE